MVGGGPFGLQPGQWTDDTSMALCLATSLIERGGFDATDHGTHEAVDTCRYYPGLLIGALRDVDKDTLLSPSYCPTERLWERDPLVHKIARVADGADTIPTPWRTKLTMLTEITSLADQLHDQAALAS